MQENLTRLKTTYSFPNNFYPPFLRTHIPMIFVWVYHSNTESPVLCGQFPMETDSLCNTYYLSMFMSNHPLDFLLKVI